MHQTQSNWRIFKYNSVDSTNSEAFRLYEAQSNDILPNVIIAQSQTGGRGQFDRKWLSPEGNLYCSFSISKSFLEWRLGERIDEANITIKIGEVVFDIIKQYLDLHKQTRTLFSPPSPTRFASGSLEGTWLEKNSCSLAESNIFKLTIKKPNDILFDGKKLAGILCEVKNDLLVIGIGINVNVAPEIIEKNSSTIEATSLKEITRKEVDMTELIKLLSNKIQEAYNKN